MQLKPLCTPDLAVNSDRDNRVISPIRCKRWSCEVCREINRRKVIAFGKAGKPTAFLTLTVSNRHYETEHEAANDLKRAWCALRRRLQRQYPSSKFPFLAVFERHKSGWPHMHLLLRAPFVPVKELRRMWEEITTHSWNVNIMALGTDGLVAYAAKYIGKDVQAFDGCKRWWRSHDFNEKRALTEEQQIARKSWSSWQAEIPAVISAFRILGCEVTHEGGERWTWRPPPERDVTIADASRLAARLWPSKASVTPIFRGRR